MYWLECYLAAGVVIFILGSVCGSRPTPCDYLPTWAIWLRALIAVSLFWPISVAGLAVAVFKLARGYYRIRRNELT